MRVRNVRRSEGYLTPCLITGGAIRYTGPILSTQRVNRVTIEPSRTTTLTAQQVSKAQAARDWLESVMGETQDPSVPTIGDLEAYTREMQRTRQSLQDELDVFRDGLFN